ncbi:MAG: hypothetical protein ACK5Q5_02410 [Planctomycetaceae bacterium]
MAPQWLQDLVGEVATCIVPVDPRAPIGCHVCKANDIWEVTLFVSRTEVFGGEFDGERVPGRFCLNVAPLISLLDELDNCWWQPLTVAADDDLGPHLSLEGRYAGHAVWIRITAEQPEDIESGRVANVNSGTIERRW